MPVSKPEFYPGDDGYYLSLPDFRQAFIDDLKRSLPRMGRRWNPGKHAWWIDKPLLDRAKEVVRRHYGASPPPVVEGKLPHSSAEAYAALWLRQGAPLALIKAMYRALAQLHHPDHGGDTKQMVIINAGYAILCADLEPVVPKTTKRR